MSGLYICELLQNFQKSKEMKYDLFEGEKKNAISARNCGDCRRNIF